MHRRPIYGCIRLQRPQRVGTSEVEAERAVEEVVEEEEDEEEEEGGEGEGREERTGKLVSNDTARLIASYNVIVLLMNR